MRLIDAEKLEEELHKRLCNPKSPAQSAGIAAAIHLVQKQPTLLSVESEKEHIDVHCDLVSYEVSLEDVLPM